MTTSETLRQRLRGWPGGVALMIVGGALAVSGLLQTTSSHGNPEADCPTGTVLVSKYNRVGNSYEFEKPAGNQSVVTITQGSDNGGAWNATRPISAVIVKGGPNSVVISLTPAQTSGAFTNTWLPKVGQGQNYPEISTVQFCGSNVATTTTSTTTTRPPTTTTTVAPTTTRPPTTTTAEPTTTTRPPTTTTAAPTTTRPPTTTTAAPTTTRPPTTTTNGYVTTEPTDPPTTLAPTTTTRPPTTTTAPGATTTTAAGGTTTTMARVSGEELTASTAPVTTSTTIVPTVLGATLPRTGASSGPLVGIGLALLLAGAAVTVVAVRRGRT